VVTLKMCIVKGCCNFCVFRDFVCEKCILNDCGVCGIIWGGHPQDLHGGRVECCINLDKKLECTKLGGGVGFAAC